ncbi:hypothetical protein QO010_004744 [Caulobacter ginsengisoli]|uniref:Uncharacterized protein n=1 Tax=Caulobacter ginsengisoli TaxID=400775 RepID=A0ABU0IY62_9CAUL|nr:hypothetical protein [Caulobacter ginsengisoli]MDQ0466947.1 hypothetical protein [Caulobacter ginsengisoli]
MIISLGRVARLFVVAAVIASTTTACATSPDKISASYVSPLQYQGYDCDQIRAEMMRVNSRVREVAAEQRKSAKNDAIAVGVGLVLFWPALFFLATSDQKEELARLKGEYDALDQSAIQKKCPVVQEMDAAKKAG